MRPRAGWARCAIGNLRGPATAAHNGEITLDLDSRELRNYLYKHLVREPRSEVAEPKETPKETKVERAT